jgi:hypothetical protein
MLIYVLTIEHKHGHDLWCHHSEQGARASLADYVRDNWDTEVGASVTKPVDIDTMIQQYFEATGGEEWWSIDHLKLLP